MHRLPSQAAVTRFRLASLFLLTTVIGGISCIGVFGYSVYHHDKELMLSAMVILLITVVMGIAQFVMASRARCPLCLTPALAKKACSKHRSAKRLFGSYRVRVATSILTSGHFRCPYCGEPTAIEVRQRRAHEA